MGRDNNTYAKRQREMEKKRKAADKRTRREKRKTDPGSSDEASPEVRSLDGLDEASPEVRSLDGLGEASP